MLPFAVQRVSLGNDTFVVDRPTARALERIQRMRWEEMWTSLWSVLHAPHVSTHAERMAPVVGKGVSILP